MARYTHASSGVKVSVADDKTLGSDWTPAEAEKPKRTTKKTDDKSDS